MGIGVSLLLLAVGAVLAFAVHVGGHAIDVNAIGVILLVAGGIGMLMSLLVTGFGTMRRRTTVVDQGPMTVRSGAAVREPYVD